MFYGRLKQFCNIVCASPLKSSATRIPKPLKLLRKAKMKTIQQMIAASLLLTSLAGLLANAAAADSRPIGIAPVTSVNAGCSNLEKTLGEFVKLAATDAKLTTFLCTNKLLIEYRISDSELTIFLGLDGDKMVSAFGQPPHPAELTMISDAQTLDRVLRGESTDLKLTVSLRLSLARKLELSRNRATLREHLSRVYSQAGDNVRNQRPTLVAQVNQTR